MSIRVHLKQIINIYPNTLNEVMNAKWYKYPTIIKDIIISEFIFINSYTIISIIIVVRQISKNNERIKILPTYKVFREGRLCIQFALEKSLIF